MGYLDSARYDSVPSRSGFVVTPDDETEFRRTKGIWVGGAGNMAVTMADGTAFMISGIQAGSLLPISVTQVRATGTTATLIVGFY